MAIVAIPGGGLGRRTQIAAPRAWRRVNYAREVKKNYRALPAFGEAGIRETLENAAFPSSLVNRWVIV